MPKSIHSGAPVRLTQGYYAIQVNMGAGADAGSVCFKSEGSVYRHTEIAFQRRGTMLVRLRETANIWLGAGNGTTGQLASLSCRRLWRLGGALVKLAGGNRLDNRIPMIDGTGYICILRGIDDAENLPRLREDAIADRAMARFGLDRGSIPHHEMFDDPFRILPQPYRPWQPALSKRGNIAVVLHLFYAELWPEFELFLNQTQRPFDLWITHCGFGDQIWKQILNIFPHAKIIEMENRGRDIWPFISLLNSNDLNDYDYICKIHSKMSRHRGGVAESLLGSRWRRRALYDLLAFGRAEMILDMFERDPRIGLAGPQVLRVPNERVSPDIAWGSIKNREMTKRLARCMGTEMREQDLDFFAGSMFWIRPAALEPLKRSDLKRDDFPEENGQLDGELQHAIERAFSVSTIKAGFKIADVRSIGHFPNGRTLPRSRLG